MSDGETSATGPAQTGPAQTGVGFVDAPVLGTRQPAEQGELVVLESGPDEARPRVQPVFDAIGHRTIRAGQAGAGTRLKLVTNSWVLAVVEAGAETIALAEGLIQTATRGGHDAKDQPERPDEGRRDAGHAQAFVEGRAGYVRPGARQRGAHARRGG